MKAHKRPRKYANVFQHPHCELPGGRDPRAYCYLVPLPTALPLFAAGLWRVGSAWVEKEAKASNDGVERFIVNQEVVH